LVVVVVVTLPTRRNKLRLKSRDDTDIDERTPVRRHFRTIPMQSVAGSPDLKRLLLYQLR
jgi:hypothetical protein